MPWNFGSYCIESIDCFCSLDILTMLIIPIYERGIFSIFICLLQFLSSVFYSAQCTDFSPPSLNLFLSILFFEAIVNGIVLLIYFSDGLLLVYRKTTDFCMLMLYLATLLNSFVSSNSFFFFFGIFGVVYIKDHIIHRGNFIFSFPIWMSFISFSCLIALFWAASTMLNRSGKSGHPCLGHDLRGKAFIFSPLSIMLAVASITLRYIPSICNLFRVVFFF